MFNKKFNDKYPDVRRPLVCNGLKAIVPYKKKDTLEVIVEPEPEPEPEPDPEMIIPDNP